MAHKPPSNPDAPPDTIPFEITDFDDARRSLDELPAGVAELAKYVPNYWEQRRRRPRPEDRALTGPAIDWVLALPAELRPRALCERYPGVANMIAAAWSRAEERALVLQSLLTDARGGRRGFPENVRREIEALSRSLSSTAGF
jgi:hypothetical protein